MRIIMPDYYKLFSCIGSDCSDNCCIGWEIDIDEETADLYRSIAGELGERLKTGAELHKSPHFKLGKDKRCPFLNEQNLCDIIISLGEKNIPYICREHPRFYISYDDVEEYGLGICCEEVCRILLKKRDSTNFLAVFNEEDTKVSLYSRNIINRRNDILELLQNHKRTLPQRIAEALSLYGDSRSSSRPFSMERLLDVYIHMEALDKKWTKTLQAAKDNINDILNSSDSIYGAYPERTIQYENLLVYFLHRHSDEAFSSGSIVDSMRIAAMSWLVIHVLDVYAHNLDKGDHLLKIAKEYSKEVEYSQDNIDILIDLGGVPGFFVEDIAAFIKTA